METKTGKIPDSTGFSKTSGVTRELTQREKIYQSATGLSQVIDGVKFGKLKAQELIDKANGGVVELINPIVNRSRFVAMRFPANIPLNCKFIADVLHVEHPKFKNVWVVAQLSNLKLREDM